MDRFHVSMMPQAAEDLVRICEYVERDSPQNAARVAVALRDAIDSLDAFPARYKVHVSRRDPSRVVRSMPVPPYIVYYRIDEGRRRVEVLSIRHGHRRQPRRFD